VEEIFGTAKRKTVTVTLHATEDDDDDLSKVKYPKMYHCVLCHLDKLLLIDGTKVVQVINPALNDDDAGAMSILCENIPIFTRVAARTHLKYTNLSCSQFLDHMTSRLDVQVESGLTQMKILCHGIFVGCYDKWPASMQKLMLLLTVFPNEFDPVSAALITETNFVLLLEHLIQFVKMGIVQVCPHSLRFCLHDLVRETFSAYITEYLGGEAQQEVQSCKERMLQHYFDLMERLNNEHRFSGIAITPGFEQYDLELENMKAIMDFMKESSTDHIECLNRCRYLIADRIFPIKRGVLYQKLLPEVDKCENEFHKADFLEGFAIVYLDLTDYNRAYTQAKRALEIKENAVILSEKGSDELELLCILKLLGDLTSTTRAYDHSKKYYERMVIIATKYAQEWQRIKVTSVDNPEDFDSDEDIILDPFLAVAQTNLAVLALYANDFKTGRKLFNRAITVLKRIYGIVHPEISKAYANYANILKQYKNVRQFYDEINALFKEAIEIDKKLFSENSIIVVERMDDYGVSLLGQSKFAEAEKIFRQTLAARKQMLGPDVIDLTLSATMNNLAVALKNQGKYEEAEQLYETSLDMLTQLLGEDHSQVCVAKANLAHVYTSNGKLDKAEKLYQEAFQILEKMPENGGNEEVMAAMLNNMGDAARQQGEFDKSIKLYQRALELRKKISADVANDPEIAKTLSSIAKLYFDKGEVAQALELQEQAQRVIEKQVGKTHPQYATGVISLANMYFKLEKYKEAEQYFQEALNLKRQLKEEEVKLISIVQSLAVTYEKQKRFRDAEILFRDVLHIVQDNKLGEEKVRSLLSSIATMLSRQNQFGEAEKYYVQAQKMVLKDFGEDSMENANILQNIGAVQLSQENYDDAEEAFAKALTIYEANLGPEHEKVINLQDHLSEIRQLIYQRDRAKKCCIIQ
jgi:tetratricopeptide (TPR) repeat protein